MGAVSFQACGGSVMQRFAFWLGLGLIVCGSSPARATAYSLTTVSDPSDPTFTQLVGINGGGTIAGYFGSGAAGHPNQGFVLTLPNNFVSQNFPGSAQTQVVEIGR